MAPNLHFYTTWVDVFGSQRLFGLPQIWKIECCLMLCLFFFLFWSCGLFWHYWATLSPGEVYTQRLYHRNAQWPTLADEWEEKHTEGGTKASRLWNLAPWLPVSLYEKEQSHLSNWGCSVYHGGHVAGSQTLTGPRAVVHLQRLMSAVPWPGALTLMLGPKKHTHIQDLGSFLTPQYNLWQCWLCETDLKNNDDYILRDQNQA